VTSARCDWTGQTRFQDNASLGAWATAGTAYRAIVLDSRVQVMSVSGGAAYATAARTPGDCYSGDSRNADAADDAGRNEASGATATKTGCSCRGQPDGALWFWLFIFAFAARCRKHKRQR